MTFQLSLLEYHLGDLEEAERLGLQALEWLERTGDRSWQLQTRRTLALCAVARSDLELAEERLQQALPLALEVGGMIVDLYRILVDVLLAQGRLRDAEDLAAIALADLPEEDLYARAAALLIRASLAAAGEDLPAVDTHFAEALELLEQARLELDFGEARFAYGCALCRLGERERGVGELLGARAELARMGARGRVLEIDRALGELTEEAGRAGPLS